MQEEKPEITQGNRKSGLAISALLISGVALYSAFSVRLKEFAVVVALISLVVAIFTLVRSRAQKKQRNQSVVAIIVSVVAAGIAIYSLVNIVPRYEERTEEIPAELHDSVTEGPDTETLDRLRMSMDTSQAGE